MAVMLVFWCLGVAAMLPAQSPPVHYLHQGVMPPGAIGSRQLMRGGPLPGFFQPVEIKAPPGVLVSLAVENNFDAAQSAPRKAGFLIGAVYRLRMTNIRLAEGVEVFPTIEVIDRLYAPPGQQTKFAIPVEITESDLKLAIDGKFVTRVIYLEDPRNALPARENSPSQNWFDIRPGQDPLAVADSMGRPVAILRLGARVPVANETNDPAFFYDSPPFVAIPAEKPANASPVRTTASISTEKKATASSPVAVARKTSTTPQQPKPTPTPVVAKVNNLPPPPDMQSLPENHNPVREEGWRP
jgi:hypothetical protein